MVGRALLTLVASGAAAALCGPAAAQAHVRLVTPPAIVGDGETRAVLRLETAGDANDLIDMTLDVDAGRIGARRVVVGAVEIDYVPPHVAAERDVHVAIAVDGVVRSAPVAIRVSPPPRAATPRTLPGALGLTAPSALVLGQGGGTTLTLRSPGTPALSVNVGTLGTPVREGAGRWRVAYTPPAQRFPQVAVVAALGSDGTIDWLTVPLHGVGRVETRTKARAQITLSIGAMSFGPFRTDASGVASTPVVAPPGVHHGTTRAVDPLGNAKETPFDLGTPPFSRLLVMCAGDAVHVFVSDEHGAPSPADEKLDWRASDGTVSGPERLAAGHYRARWRPRAGEDHAEVRVGLQGETASQGRCSARVPEADPIGIALEIDRPSFVAGSGPLVVTARLRHPDARGGRAAAIVLTSDDGAIETVEAVEAAGGVPGTTARWRLADQLAGRTHATVHARTTSPSLTAELTVPLAAGPVAHVRLARGRGALVADGKSRTRIAIAVEDAFGNPARAETLAAAAHDAALPVTVTADGSASVDYVAPPAGRAVDDQVTVRDPESGATASLAMRLQPPPRPFSLGARLGYLANFGKISAPLVLVDADWHPRWLRRRLALGLAAGFYQASHRESDAATSGSLTLTVTGLPILARLGYALPLGRFGLYAGAGVGLLVAYVATRSTVGGSDATTSVLGAFEAHLGGDVGVGFGRLVVEADFLYAPDSSGAITGNFGGLAVTAGYRVGL
ncbi:MAG: hypothetical protein JWN44_6451 [Myxococcales bacterium]|nr:hypothetical protein [Myxococcales bacterium]